MDSSWALYPFATIPLGRLMPEKFRMTGLKPFETASRPSSMQSTFPVPVSVLSAGPGEAGKEKGES